MKIIHVKEISEDENGKYIKCPVCGYKHYTKKGDKLKSFSSKLLDDGRFELYCKCYNCNDIISYGLDVIMLGKPNHRFILTGESENIDKKELEGDGNVK